MSDMISRQAAVDAIVDCTVYGDADELEEAVTQGNDWHRWPGGVLEALEAVKELSSAQPEPSEITDEQAILHLQSTGWMQNHDREMYESGLREQLADDSGSYDSLIPYEDTISRQAAIDAFYKHPNIDWTTLDILAKINALPSAQPEPLVKESRTLVKDLVKDTISRQATIDALVKAIRKDPYYDTIMRAERRADDLQQ